MWAATSAVDEGSSSSSQQGSGIGSKAIFASLYQQEEEEEAGDGTVDGAMAAGAGGKEGRVALAPVERVVAHARKLQQKQQEQEQEPLVDKENVGPNRMQTSSDSGSGSGGKGEVAVLKKPQQHGGGKSGGKSGSDAALAVRKRELLEQCARMI